MSAERCSAEDASLEQKWRQASTWNPARQQNFHDPAIDKRPTTIHYRTPKSQSCKQTAVNSLPIGTGPAKHAMEGRLVGVGCSFSGRCSTAILHTWPTVVGLEVHSLTYTVNTRYRQNHVTGTLFRCTNFPPPNRLRYRHRHTTLQAHKIAICACNEF